MGPSPHVREKVEIEPMREAVRKLPSGSRDYSSARVCGRK